MVDALESALGTLAVLLERFDILVSHLLPLVVNGSMKRLESETAAELR
jgi:hypothetical protein